jgi:ssDNA-binding Zn-finger/Zn-ribbon topoisomerase 1
MGKIKYRKCPECGGKMVVRKSGKGNKFWGCTMWKENDCRGSAEYNGSGARAGLNLTIREIENGLIITTSSPYGGVNDDPVELHVKDNTELSSTLKGLIDLHVELLCKELENSTEFTDEIDTTKHEKRVVTAKRGTTDVGELLKRMAAAKAKEGAGEKAVAPEA